MNHPSPLHHDTDAKLPAAAYLRYESRADGWSAGRQAAFLSHLADNGLVEDAARSVGMSVGGGYSLRRTARGYAFNLGWEAALIIARRVISDRLMTAAIKGEEARWVREEGVTTYTRQNTKLSLTLLDRINPATTLSEVMAVATRFDWFLQLIDEGASAEELWDLFFDDALPTSDIEARSRVRASLLLCEESAGFDEDEDEEEDEPPIEYKSMDGPPCGSNNIKKRAGDYCPGPAAVAQLSRAGVTGRASCGDTVFMPISRRAGAVLAIASGLLLPTTLSAATPPAAPPPLVCAAIAPLPADLAAIAKAKPGIERETVKPAVDGPLLGGTLGCVETLDASGSKIAVMRSEEFTLQGVKGRIVYNESSVSIALDPSRMPRRVLSSIGAGDFHCSWPAIGTNSARCEVGIDADANMRMIGLAANEGQVAALEVYPALFRTGTDAMDADKPVRLYNAAGASMEMRWDKGQMVFIQFLKSLMFEGAPFVSIINGLKPGDYLSVEAYERGKDKPSIRRAEASVVIGNLNTALALAEALRKK
jgi:hypothetical protein